MYVCVSMYVCMYVCMCVCILDCIYEVGFAAWHLLSSVSA